MRSYCPSRQHRIRGDKSIGHRDQHRVLTIRVRHLVIPLEFNTDREIITTRAAAKTRLTSVPGAATKRYKLNQFAIPAYQQVRRDLEATNLGKIWMSIPIERIRKQLLDLRTAELARRKADAMHD